MPAAQETRTDLRVLADVVFGCLVGVLACVQRVTVGQVRVMSCLLVIAGFVVRGGFAMVLGCVFVVFGRALMVLRASMITRHSGSSW